MTQPQAMVSLELLLSSVPARYRQQLESAGSVLVQLALSMLLPASGIPLKTELRESDPIGTGKCSLVDGGQSGF